LKKDNMQVKKAEAHSIFNKLQIQYRSESHNYGWLRHEGKAILPVYFSHGRGDMPAKVGDKFRQSLKINEEQFRALRDCPLTREGYIGILKEKKLI